MFGLIRVLLAIASLIFVSNASALTYKLTFEGLKDHEQILEFYNGGTGSMGSSGTNYGVSFGSSALGIIQTSAGGTGNFSNNPSGSTIAFWLTGSGVTMNVAAGFSTGFSFYYSSSEAVAVTVYDGLNGTGNVLGTINLAAQSQANGCSDQSYCNWTPTGVAFSGTARSVNFGGGANYTGYDDITFGTATPIAPAVTSVNPTSGPTIGSTSVTITGTGFVSGATASFGGSACNVTGTTATSLTCTTTAHSAGAVDVVVTNTDTQTGTLSNGFTYVAASVVAQSIPTLSEWGTIILSGLMLLGAFVVMRRKQA